MSFTSEVFQEALRFCKGRWRVLLSTGALLLVPIAIVRALIAVAGGYLEAAPWSNAWTSGLGGAVVEIVAVLAQAITQAALVLLISDHLAGGNLDGRRTWQRLLGQVRPVLTASGAGTLLTLGWMFLLLVPGVVVGWILALLGLPEALHRGLPIAAAIWLASSLMAFVVPAAVIERKPGFAATERNARLREHNGWTIARTLLPVYAVWTAIWQTMAWALQHGPLFETAHTLIWWLITPVEAACTVLLYLKIRGENEQYGIPQLRAELDR